MQEREDQKTSRAYNAGISEIDKLIISGKLRRAKKVIDIQLCQGNTDMNLFQKQAEVDQLLGSTLLFAKPKKLIFETALIQDNKSYPSTEDSGLLKPIYIKKNLNEREGCGDNLELLACDKAYATQTYGIHDEAGYPFWGTVLIRGKNKVNYPRGYPTKIPPPTNIQLRFKKAFYINFLQLKNFGHLLTDGASAIYPLIQWKLHNSNLNLMPIIINESDSSQDFQIQLLTELLKIDKSQIYIPGKTCGNIEIQTLYQSKPSYILGIQPSKRHPQIVRDLLKQKQEIDEEISPTKGDGNFINRTKLYISRSKLTENNRHLKEEHEIEAHLRELGWTIFHPQEYSIQCQLNTYESCKIICGEEGSAIHLLFGLGMHDIKQVILLTQSPKNNFTLQLECQSIPKTIINCLVKNPKCHKLGTRQDLQLDKNIKSQMIAKTIDSYASIALSK